VHIELELGNYKAVILKYSKYKYRKWK